MDLLNLFGAKKIEGGGRPYKCVVDCKVKSLPNSLPRQFPFFYAEPPKDNFAQREHLLRQAKRTSEQILRACHHNDPRTWEVVSHNFQVLLDSPLIYESFLSLERHKLTRYLQNIYGLCALFQALVFNPTNDLAKRMRDSLPLCLTGICLRFYGVNQVSPETRSVLSREIEYNVGDARQFELRKQFLKAYRDAAGRLAQLSSDKLQAMLEAKSTLEEDEKRAFLHIVRYSPRLMGRAAEDIRENELASLHAFASYMGVLHGFVSAWTSRRKLAAVTLAEEWERHRVYASKKDFTAHGLYNPHALQDLFRFCQCVLITNFQGKERDAVYCIADEVLVKQKKVYAELKSGSRHSVRRFLSSRRIKRILTNDSDETPTAEPAEPQTAEETPTELETPDPIGETKVLMRWQAYHSQTPIRYQARCLSDSMREARRPNNDPNDRQLTEIPCEFRED